MKHPFAEILQAIINGEETQYYHEAADEWVTQSSELTLQEIASGEYSPEEYRVKPRTIRIGDYDVPEPLRVAPEAGQLYYVPTPHWDDGYVAFMWEGNIFDLRQLRNGHAHSTEEAATLHSKAIISLTKVK